MFGLNTSVFNHARINGCRLCERSFYSSQIKNGLRDRLRARKLKPRTKRSKTKKLLFASVLGGSTIAAGYLAVKSPKIGPIYEFEEKNVLPLDYNIEEMEVYFNERHGEIFGRTAEILGKLVPYMARLLVWEYLVRGKINDHEGLQKKYAVELREILTNLGPCFIKLGQAISIRPDLLPSPFLVQLQKLCDAVPSYPTSEAMAVVESELGIKVEDVFLDLHTTTSPIAAASLGQVYKVRLRAEPGVVLGLKVQRPDMHHYVLRDIFIVRRLAHFMQWIKTTFSNQRPYDVALLDTFASATLKELDYVNEAQNQIRCKDELEPRLKNKIYIPKVYSQFTSRKVLVTEWIEGEQLAKSSPDVINRLIPVGVECFLIQLLETGFFHADPHPGNLLVTQDGRLALIDFGLMADVPIQDTTTMTMTIVHLMQGDVPGLVEDAVQLGFLPQDVDRSSLTPILQRVFDSAELAVTDQVKKAKYGAVAGRRKQFWAVSSDLNKIFYLYPFLVPDYFALITRAMIVLEGIAVTGDPDFDLFRAAYPYSFKRAVHLFGFSGIKQIATEAAQRMLDMGLEDQRDVILNDLNKK